MVTAWICGGAPISIAVRIADPMSLSGGMWNGFKRFSW
jgi:hypothetical protein